MFSIRHITTDELDEEKEYACRYLHVESVARGKKRREMCLVRGGRSWMSLGMMGLGYPHTLPNSREDNRA